MKKYSSILVTMWLTLALVLAACGGAATTEEAPADEADTAEEAPAEEEADTAEEAPAEEEADTADDEMADDEMADDEMADDEMTDDEMADDEMATEDEMAEDEMAVSMPGEGITVSPGRATWDTGWFQAAIFNTLLTELGYEVEDPTTVDNPAFYLSAAEGDLHFWANGWFPLHNTFIQNEDVQGQVEQVGQQVESGALQGYLIDKATADEMGITNLEDLQDPEMAAVFDSDGNGQANLVGCNPGWGCEAVIEHHLDAYELRDTVEHVQGEYSLLMADVISRFESGEPVLFYTWTPNWTVAELVPGEDVVWIEVPFASLPEDQAEMEDQTVGEGIAGCVNDPCNMGFPPNDIQVVANAEFLESNPAADRLFELVEIPLQDIADQNVLMVIEEEDSEDDIQRHAQEWIEENRETIDGWLEEARAAAEGAPAGEADTTDEEATDEEMAEDAEATEDEATEDEMTASMPGEGITVSPGRATWDTGWFQAAIFNTLLTELGYEVEDPTTVDNPAFYLSAAEGDLQFWANGWFPLHNTFIQNEDVQGQVEQVGQQVESGALQGYLIDKATADEMGITNLEDLQDPEMAAVFDSDGNGQANLVGCNPGWGCEAVIEHHLDAYELRDTVEHVQGEYSLLMADVISRFESGEPVLFYTWTPNWTVAEMVPGEDVVWIEVPFPSLPEDQAEMEDQTVGEGIAGCVSDPCDMGFPPNDIQVVANAEFLESNPAAARLFELVEIPLQDIADQNVLMVIEEEDSEDDIQRHAQEWIEENRETIDGWLEEARAAAES